MAGLLGCIRAANAEDARHLTELAISSKAYWGYDADFMAACRKELTVTAEALLASLSGVFENAGDVAGFYLLSGSANRDVAELEYFFVSPDQIGLGIGNDLWRHMAAAARAKPFKCIRIESDPNAEPFYKRMGAQTVGTTPSCSIPGRVLPLMEFIL